MHAHDCVVGAARHQGPVDRLGVGTEIGDQVQHLMAEGHVEVAPADGDALRRQELQGAASSKAAGVGDRTRGGVIPNPSPMLQLS